MREKQKLINWIAGMTTVIVALLIVIVVMEPKDNGGTQFYVPVHNQAAVSKLRKLLTRLYAKMS